MLEMLIIGGGIHGVHLAHCLLQQTPMSRDDIRIVDPHNELLHEWHFRTGNCGMKYLRSSSVHHLDAHPFSLRRFAAQKENRKDSNFIQPKDRPSLELFDAHSRMVIDRYQLDSLHLQDRVVELQDRGSYINVLTAGQTLKTRSVLLAIGMGEQPLWPGWAVRLREKGIVVHHVFEHDFCLDDLLSGGPVAVIGGGISGGHVALRMVEKSKSGVTLISKSEVSVSNFDFAPGWIGPRYTEPFYRSPLDQRRQQIVDARAKGSVPEDMKLALDKAVTKNQLSIMVDDITAGQRYNGGALLLGLQNQIECQKVVLATGFVEKRPDGGFLTRAIGEFNLKTAACGFPLVNPSLKWHDRIFVTGPLSELQIGPVARNIVGARHASARITAAYNEEINR